MAEIQTNTIENVIYIKMYNDVSFLVDGQMTLYELIKIPNPRFIVFYNGDTKKKGTLQAAPVGRF